MFKKIWQLIRLSFDIWGKANSSRMAAAMTYFTMLSLAPLLMMAIAIAGFLFGDQIAEHEIVERVSQFTTDELAATVAALIKNASRPESGLIAGTVSVAILVFGASGVFSQLHDTFNEIWHVPIEDRSGWFFLLRTRLVGVSLVLIAGILLVVTIFFSTSLHGFSDWAAEFAPRSVYWLNLIDKGVTFLLTPLIFSLFFWLLPAAKIKWKDVWVAGIVTALLVFASRYLVGLYLKMSTASEVYGAAGSLVVLLIWVYINGVIVFYGASFSHAWAQVFGSRANVVAASEQNAVPGEAESDEA
jgi:membrane protein